MLGNCEVLNNIFKNLLIRHKIVIFVACLYSLSVSIFFEISMFVNQTGMIHNSGTRPILSNSKQWNSPILSYEGKWLSWEFSIWALFHYYFEQVWIWCWVVGRRFLLPFYFQISCTIARSINPCSNRKWPKRHSYVVFSDGSHVYFQCKIYIPNTVFCFPLPIAPSCDLSLQFPKSYQRKNQLF